jgi:hypothetical protein
MPLVRASSPEVTQGSGGLQLLATDIDHYIHRIASEEDFQVHLGRLPFL